MPRILNCLPYWETPHFYLLRILRVFAGEHFGDCICERIPCLLPKSWLKVCFLGCPGPGFLPSLLPVPWLSFIFVCFLLQHFSQFPVLISSQLIHLGLFCDCLFSFKRKITSGFNLNSLLNYNFNSHLIFSCYKDLKNVTRFFYKKSIEFKISLFMTFQLCLGQMVQILSSHQHSIS